MTSEYWAIQDGGKDSKKNREKKKVAEESKVEAGSFESR